MLLAVEDCRQEINVGLLGRFIWSIFTTLPAFRQVFSTGKLLHSTTLESPKHCFTSQNTGVVCLPLPQLVSLFYCVSSVFNGLIPAIQLSKHPSMGSSPNPRSPRPPTPHLLRGGNRWGVFPSQLTEVTFPVFPGPALSLFPAENIQNISPRRCSGGVLLRCTKRLNWLLSMWSISSSTLSHCHE